MDTSRAWAEIDLDALTKNLQLVRTRIGPRPAILLVAKADAYGHGAVPIAHHALRVGVDAIGVTTCAEAMELREAGIRARIVVLGAVFGEEAVAALAHGVEIGVPSRELGARLEETARRLGRVARVHLKVDTGMNRLGILPEHALPMLRTIRASRHLELAGVMTHIAATEGALSPATAEQMARFRTVLDQARERDLLQGRDVWVHAANSACILSGLMPLFDAVRPGCCAYGIRPDPRLTNGDLAPVMTVRTRIVHVKEIPAGARVGYGGIWTAARPSRIAVLPVGYDDGVDWRLANRGHVLLRGQRAPIVGRISMDYTTVDVTRIPGVRLGDLVTLLGRDGAREIRVEDIARMAGTIPYDVTCSIGKRVLRVFRGGERAETPESRRWQST
ncbi:MAG: alanine racemase [Planctomycetota bacterium]